MNIAFWIFIFLFMLLVPLIMIFFGIKFQKAAPKNINPSYGYRTERSMKNRDTWEFAHKCIGRVWKNWGIALLPISVLPMFFFLGKDVKTIGNAATVLTAVQLGGLIIPIFIEEGRLKKTFDKYGRRKSHWE